MIAIDSSSLILIAKIYILDKIIKNLQKRLTITDPIYSKIISKKDTFDARIITINSFLTCCLQKAKSLNTSYNSCYNNSKRGKQ